MYPRGQSTGFPGHAMEGQCSGSGPDVIWISRTITVVSRWQGDVLRDAPPRPSYGIAFQPHRLIKTLL
jgi:hypothetical protein